MPDLFSEFPSRTTADWEAQITRELKGGPSEKLYWETYEEISIPPFFIPKYQSSANYLSSLPARPPAGWQTREYLRVTDTAEANAAAHEAFEAGAEGILFDLNAVPDADLNRLLARLNLNQQPVSFLTDDNQGVARRLQQLNPSLTAVKGSLQNDPFRRAARRGTSPSDKDFDLLAEQTRPFAESTGFFPLTVDTDTYRAAGANITQELTYSLAAAVATVEALRARGLPTDVLFGSFEFAVPVDVSFYREVAKLRALRWLWHKVGEAYGTPVRHVSVYARTAAWSRAETDPATNLLRHTTEAIAAVCGGCDVLTVWPHTPEHDAGARRLARNIPILLREEAYLDKVQDPAAGAYLFDHLTDQLVEKAWGRFREVQAQGGWQAVFASGALQDDIARVREKRVADLAEGRRPLVGTSKYLATGETPSVVAPPADPPAGALPALRASQLVRG